VEKSLLANRTKVRQDWDKLVQSGLGDQYQTVTAKISTDIEQMLRTCRITAQEFKADRPTDITRSDFKEIPYSLRFNTASANLATLIHALETAGLPIRIDGMNISSKKEGQDNLNVELRIVSLLYSPQPASTRIVGTQPATRPGVAGAGSTTRPAATPVRTGTAAPAAAAAPSTGGKTPEQIEAELKARRAREESGQPDPAAAGATPAAPAAGAVAATPAAPKTPEQIEAELKARRARENGEAVDTAQPTTQPAGGVR